MNRTNLRQLCKSAGHIEVQRKSIYMRTWQNRPLKRPRMRPGASTNTDWSSLKFPFSKPDISISINQIHTNSCNYVNDALHTSFDYYITTCHRTTKMWHVWLWWRRSSMASLPFPAPLLSFSGSTGRRHNRDRARSDL